MEYKLILRDESKRNVREISAWYDQQAEGLGKDFFLKYREAVKLLEDFPEIGKQVDKKFRRVLPKKYPYAIYYYLRKQKKELVVVAVMHTRRSKKFVRKTLKLNA
jgi:plasmid stabilization system protein ParE